MSSSSTTGGKLFREIDAEAQAWADAQPILTLCGFCDWRYEGTAADGRAAAAVHRAEQHPDAVKTRRKKPVGVLAHKRDDNSERREEAMVEVERRKKTTHAVLDEDAVGEPPAASSSSAVAAVGHLTGSSSAPPLGELERAATPLGPTQQAVVDAINANCTTAAAIADRLGRGRKLVDNTLARLMQRGFVVRVDRGVYALKDSEREPGRQASAPADHGPTPVAAAPTGKRPSRSDETALVRRPAPREPLRFAEIPYDADILESEVAFLRERARALEVIAGGIRRLAALSEATA